MGLAKVNIAVTDDYFERFTEVVDAAREAGLDVDQELAEIGVVSGSIETEKLADLARVAGVEAVEESRTFQIAPPWSETQ